MLLFHLRHMYNNSKILQYASACVCEYVSECVYVYVCVCVAFRVTHEKGLTRMNCFCVYQHIYFFCNDYENIFFFLKSRKLVLKYSHEIIVFIYVFWTIFVFEVDEKRLTLEMFEM